jgi:hypothetical protein
MHTKLLPHPPMLKLEAFVGLWRQKMEENRVKLCGVAIGNAPLGTANGKFRVRRFRSEIVTIFYSLDSSANTFCSIFCPLSKLSTRNRSSTKCALSLACPIGKLTALAPNSFSNQRIPGIDPPYTNKVRLLQFHKETGTVLPGCRWVGYPTRLRRPVPAL